MTNPPSLTHLPSVATVEVMTESLTRETVVVTVVEMLVETLAEVATPVVETTDDDLLPPSEVDPDDLLPLTPEALVVADDLLLLLGERPLPLEMLEMPGMSEKTECQRQTATRLSLTQRTGES